MSSPFTAVINARLMLVENREEFVRTSFGIVPIIDVIFFAWFVKSGAFFNAIREGL